MTPATQTDLLPESEQQAAPVLDSKEGANKSAALASRLPAKSPFVRPAAFDQNHFQQPQAIDRGAHFGAGTANWMRSPPAPSGCVSANGHGWCTPASAHRPRHRLSG